MSRRWHVPEPQPTRCDHDHDNDREICTLCALHLADLLADIPALNQELDTAITKQTAFVERGQRRTDEKGDNDEAPVLFNIGASKAKESLAKAVKQLPAGYRGDIEFKDATGAANAILDDYRALLTYPAVNDYLETLSKAVTRAHQAIERPKDTTFAGLCPNDHPLWTDKGDETVACNACGYHSVRSVHYREAVNNSREEWLTVNELLAALTVNGLQLTRDGLNYKLRTWTKPKDGPPIARQELAQAKWVNGVLVKSTSKPVYQYRLGEVLDRLAGV